MLVNPAIAPEIKSKITVTTHEIYTRCHNAGFESIKLQAGILIGGSVALISNGLGFSPLTTAALLVVASSASLLYPTSNSKRITIPPCKPKPNCAESRLESLPDVSSATSMPSIQPDVNESIHCNLSTENLKECSPYSQAESDEEIDNIKTFINIFEDSWYTSSNWHWNCGCFVSCLETDCIRNLHSLAFMEFIFGDENLTNKMINLKNDSTKWSYLRCWIARKLESEFSAGKCTEQDINFFLHSQDMVDTKDANDIICDIEGLNKELGKSEKNITFDWELFVDQLISLICQRLNISEEVNPRCISTDSTSSLIDEQMTDSIPKEDLTSEPIIEDSPTNNIKNSIAGMIAVDYYKPLADIDRSNIAELIGTLASASVSDLWTQSDYLKVLGNEVGKRIHPLSFWKHILSDENLRREALHIQTNRNGYFVKIWEPLKQQYAESLKSQYALGNLTEDHFADFIQVLESNSQITDLKVDKDTNWEAILEAIFGQPS
jgi:hypothetical protein